MYNYIMYSTVAMQCAIGSVKTLHVIVSVNFGPFWMQLRIYKVS